MQKNKVEIVVSVDTATGEAHIKNMSEAMSRAGREGERAFKRADQAVGRLDHRMREARISGVNLLSTYLGYRAVSDIFRAINTEATAGFRAVEDYRLSMATMTGFMVTNSRKLQEGDLAGAYREANTYAEKLIPKLELIAATTLGTGRDLKAITETMMMHGVVLDINNQKEVNGLKNITNVLKMVTAGQNQDIQMRQEINSLLSGQIRMQDRLPTLLKAIDPNLKEHLKLWRQQGTVIENVGALLQGFDPATQLVEQTWTSIGTTMETINTKVLRGGMQPAFQDLMDMAREINALFMDKDGNLTQFSYDIQENIHDAWDYSKHLGTELKNLAFDPETAKVIKALAVMAGVSTGLRILIGAASVTTTPVGAAAAVVGGGYYLSQHLHGQRPNTDPRVHSTLGGNSPGVETWFPPVLQDSLQRQPELYVNTGKVLSNERMIELAARKAEVNGRPETVKPVREITPRLTKQPHLETEAEWQAKANAALAKHNAMLREGKHLTEALYTPQEKYNAAVARYKNLLAAGAIDLVTYNRAVAAAGDELENMSKKGVTAADEMEAAFSGWFNSFTNDLNNALWTADNTFGDIALSFGKMLTKMAIQKKIVEPLVDGLSSGGVFKWLAGIFHEGGVVGEPAPARAVSPAVFSGAPRLHSGLLPDEFPAILQRGETVIPRGGFPQSATSQTVSVQIHNDGSEKKAADTQVHFDARGFVVDVFLEDMDANGPIKQAMAGGAL